MCLFFYLEYLFLLQARFLPSLPDLFQDIFPFWNHIAILEHHLSASVTSSVLGLSDIPAFSNCACVQTARIGLYPWAMVENNGAMRSSPQCWDGSFLDPSNSSWGVNGHSSHLFDHFFHSSFFICPVLSHFSWPHEAVSRLLLCHPLFLKPNQSSSYIDFTSRDH